MLIVRQEVAAGILPGLGLHGLADFVVRQALETEQLAAELHVRDGFDIEHQGVHRALRVRLPDLTSALARVFVLAFDLAFALAFFWAPFAALLPVARAGRGFSAA